LYKRLNINDNDAASGVSVIPMCNLKMSC